MLPNGKLVEIPDSYTLIGEDQPAALANAIREFVVETRRAEIAMRESAGGVRRAAG
jgi:hypothetical protein